MSTKTTNFVPEPIKGPPEDQGTLAAIVRTFVNLGLIFYYMLEAFVLLFVPSKFRMKSIKDDIVLVTGAGSGIGRLMAIKFAAQGAKIVCWDINKEGIDETVKTIKGNGGTAYAYVCNVADRNTVYSVADQVRKDVGKVSIVINNARIVTGKKFLEIPDEGIERTFQVNAMAHFWILKAFLPDMMASNHGHIVSIASLAGQVGCNRLTDYCASKFAAVGFAEALALELYQDGYNGIHSTIVCPYFIDTGMFKGASPGAFSWLQPEHVADEVLKATLLNKDLLFIPGHLTPLIATKFLLPYRSKLRLIDITQLNYTMLTFKGRSHPTV